MCVLQWLKMRNFTNMIIQWGQCTGYTTCFSQKKKGKIYWPSEITLFLKKMTHYSYVKIIVRHAHSQNIIAKKWKSPSESSLECNQHPCLLDINTVLPCFFKIKSIQILYRPLSIKINFISVQNCSLLVNGKNQQKECILYNITGRGIYS